MIGPGRRPSRAAARPPQGDGSEASKMARTKKTPGRCGPGEVFVGAGPTITFQRATLLTKSTCYMVSFSEYRHILEARYSHSVYRLLMLLTQTLTIVTAVKSPGAISRRRCSPSPRDPSALSTSPAYYLKVRATGPSMVPQRPRSQARASIARRVRRHN